MDTAECILLVEGDPKVGARIVCLLEAASYIVDGPYTTLADGMAALADKMPSGAILDVRLKDGGVGLLADDLDAYAIPYLFSSGTISGAMMNAHPNAGLVPDGSVDAGLVKTLRGLLH